MKQKESGQKDASSSCKLNCQNGKSKSGWQHKKTQDKKKHHLLANHLAKMNLSWVSKSNFLTEIKLPIETKRIRSKGSFIFLQIKLPKWQIQNQPPTKAKENAIGIGKSHCQNGKLPIETKKWGPREALSFCKFNCTNDKSKLNCQQGQRKMPQLAAKANWQQWQKQANMHVSLFECGCELSDSQPEKDRKKGACIFC